MFTGSLSDGTTTIQLYAAGEERQNVAVKATPTGTFLAKSLDLNLDYANCFAMPLHEAGRGWVVISSDDLDRLDLNARFVLTFNSDSPAVESLTFSNLIVCKPPQTIQSNLTVSVCMVELADVRWLLKNPRFSVPINTQYNVRIPNFSSSTYYTASLNSGTAWTWATMTQDIWNVMGSWLGAFPGLPFTPDGTPEGWQFQGVSAWDALTAILRRIGCAVTARFGTLTFTIVRIGSTDATTEAAITAAQTANRKLHDGEFGTIVRGWQPYGTRVFFRRQQAYLSPTRSEVDLGEEWTVEKYYTVDVAGPNITATEVIYTPIFDDLPAIYDDTHTLTNAAALATRAAERSADYFRMLGSSGGFLRWQRYSGLLQIAVGETLKGVRWTANQRGIWTEIVRDPGFLALSDSGEWIAAEPAKAYSIDAVTDIGISDTYLAITNGVITARSTSFTAVATLTASMTDSQSTVPVSSVAALPAGYALTILIDSEEIRILVTSGVANVVCRGVNGTTAAAHSSGAAIYRVRATYGSGSVHLITAAQQSDAAWDEADTCLDIAVLNACDAINNGTLVQLYREPSSGQLFVYPLCTAPTPGTGTESGSGGGFEGCPTCVTFTTTGITSPGSTDCSVLNSTFTLLNSFGISADPDVICSSGCFTSDGLWYVLFGLETSGYFAGRWVLHFIGIGAGVGDIAYKSAVSPGWSGTPGLVLTLDATYSGGATPACGNWPATITVSECAGGTTAPTIDAGQTADICQDASGGTFTGTHFETTAANNILTFNLGATGHCTSATTTEITYVFDTNPTSTGNLTVIVENVNGSSLVAVQVATVIDCVTAIWNDTFTGVDGTLLTSHTPDTSPGGSGYTDLSGAGVQFKILSNQIGEGSGAVTGPNVSFDPGQATSRASIDFVFKTGVHFELDLIPRYTLGGVVAAWIGDNADGGKLYINDSGGTVSSGTLSLVDGNTYTLTVENTPTQIKSTCNSVSLTHTTVEDYGSTEWELAAASDGISGSTDNEVIADNLKVTKWA